MQRTLLRQQGCPSFPLDGIPTQCLAPLGGFPEPTPQGVSLSLFLSFNKGHKLCWTLDCTSDDLKC